MGAALVPRRYRYRRRAAAATARDAAPHHAARVAVAYRPARAAHHGRVRVAPVARQACADSRVAVPMLRGTTSGIPRLPPRATSSWRSLRAMARDEGLLLHLPRHRVSMTAQRPLS